MITLIKAGPLTTVQDLGRPGYAHLGVPRSGAADVVSLRRANRLAGNPDHAAALEMTLLGAQLRFERETTCALSGAEMPVTLDGSPLAHDCAFTAARGQVLQMGAAKRGVRAYLAVAGGIDVPPVLGSRSTDLLSALGPAPLRDGDRLALGDSHGADGEPEPAIFIADEAVLRVTRGPRDDWFVPEAFALLCSAPYRVTPSSNRIGLRLKGAALARAIARELPSEGVVLGAVQVPADGQPLIFLADHPTTGGYPVIAVVAAADVPAVAQARPGSTLRFQPA